MKLHLRILYGADDRLQIVKDTVNVCCDYFDTVKIVNSGPKELSTSLRKFVNKKVQIEDLNYFFGDLDAARRSLYHDIPCGDWFMWLDSDERPTQDLLENLNELIHQCETEGVTTCSFYNLQHQYDESSRNENPNEFGGYPWKWLNHNLSWRDFLPKLSKNEALDKAIPHWPRLCKKTKSTEVHNNFGGHGSICNDFSYGNYVLSKWPICHFKHEVMIYQSNVLSTYFNVGINLSVKDSVNLLINSPQYKLIRDFQKNTGAFLNNDLCLKLHINKDKIFKEQFMSLATDPILQDTSYFGDLNVWTYYSAWNIWAKKFDLSWDTPDHYCGYECCKYDSIQL
jgi:hypothetical protein